MRFIQKTQSPDFFEQEKTDFPLTDNSSWNDFQNPCKRKLKSFLVEEQQKLCIYCECDIGSINTTHLEHLKPRSSYSHLKFEYENLVVSCNGKFVCESPDKNRQSCGHKKEDAYDEECFLNPVELPEINDYFTYEAETGAILPVEGKMYEQSAYMIRLLNLDDGYLRDARKNAKEALLDYLNSFTSENGKDINKILRIELSSDREFVSFLRHCFKSVLN